jgi:hypothetical protein
MKIDAEPNPAHRERLRRQMLQAFEPSGRAAEAMHASPARVFRFPFVRLAVAAAILMAATAAVWLWFGSTGQAAFDRVRLATKQMPWMHAVATRHQNGEVRTEQYWHNFAAQETFVVQDDGAVIGWEHGAAQEKLVYSPRLRVLAISDLPKAGLFGADSAYNLVDSFAVFAARDDVEVQEWTAEHEGKTVRAYGLEAGAKDFSPLPGVDNRRVAKLRMTVMADPETNRVVAADIERHGSDGGLLAREEWVVSYPPAGPASVYDLGVPRTARVMDMRQGYIGTPSGEPTPAPTPAPVAGVRMEPLRIELPRPLFSGTPQNRRVPNLEKPRAGGRPPFLAPAGTVNLALGKPVSSSDREPLVGSLDLITDGDKQAAEDTVVELGPFLQHVTIDLQQPCEIYAIAVWHQHRWPREYFDVIVQVSDDRTFRTGVRTIFNNDIDNSAGRGRGRDMHYTETYEGKLIDGRGVPGRYVRLYSNGNTNDELNHYIEVEVYGRPVN